MSLGERLVVLVLLGGVLAVYGAAGAVVVEWVARHFRPAERPLSRPAAWARYAVLGLAGLGTLCVAYAHFIEPRRLQVTHVCITSAKLSSSSRSIRIVHISDLHCEAESGLEQRLPDVIRAEWPDIIVFTGDALNSAAGLPGFKDCMTRIGRIAPTFAVSGNWDAWYWRDLDLYGGTGVRRLTCEAVPVEVRGTEVWVAGAPPDGGETIGLTMARVPAGALCVFLYHYPSAIAEVSRCGADLLCAGHTHGGQVALPFYGALITLSATGKRHEAGLYRVDRTWLYVNRGIGMEGGVPRLRFCARPEVTVIDIEPLTKCRVGRVTPPAGWMQVKATTCQGEAHRGDFARSV